MIEFEFWMLCQESIDLLLVFAGEEAAIASCMVQLQNFSPQNAIKSSQKSLWQIYVPKIMDSALSLNPAEYYTIFAIANQCPLSGGDVVFEARSILSSIGYSTAFNDDLLCTPPLQQTKKSATSNTTSLIVSNDQMLLQLPEFENLKELCLLDINGKMIQKYDVTEIAQMNIILPNSIPSGVYLIQLNYINQPSEVKRVVIK
ncbi:MAG: T9SS type A sorting domain-containing protein [Saprospiraceae bacterium]